MRVKSLIDFFDKGIWRLKLDELPKTKSILYKELRILITAVKGYLNDECAIRASALTFFSMLSIVPVFAMIFGIAKGFGIEDVLEKQMRQEFYGQGDIVEKIIEFAKSLLDSTNGGVVAGIGFLLVLYSVLKLLTNIEETFNTAWKITEPRTLYRKLTDYTTFIVIAPILFTVSSSISVFVISNIESVAEQMYMTELIESILTIALEFVSFALICMLMILLYILLPHTKVTWKAAVQAGILAGAVFIIVQWIYVNFQIGVSRANAVYGSFAALPLFLVWLQTSWFIVIFGAEYAYAVQFVDKFNQEPELDKLSEHTIKIVALLITSHITKVFERGEKAQNPNEIAENVQLPANVVNVVLELLIKGKVITKISQEDVYLYQPALDINKISISFVLNALEDKGNIDLAYIQTKEAETLRAIFKEFRQITANAGTNKLLKDI